MDRLEYLRQRFFDNTATGAEREELYQLLKNIDPETSEFFKPLDTELAKGAEDIDDEERKRLDAMYARIEEKIQGKSGRGKEVSLPAEDSQSGNRFRMLRIAASISILILIGYGLYEYQDTDDASRNISVVQDIKPGGDKAILRLADGSQVELNGEGTAIPRQGTAQIVSDSGSLTYQVTSEAKEIIYNTISTPRGGQYQLTLSDGTKVWLNAASSLKFPASFSRNERNVELTGEAYFEVTHNKEMPFKVRIPSGEEVAVLGTHFNVMAYAEEELMKTTLLEGSVRVTSKKGNSTLAPNQQALITKQGDLSIVRDYNVNEAVAWKNGSFVFNDTELEVIMRQVARWYDVEVVYENDLRDLQFGGLVSRKENVSAVLNLLELTAAVDFEIQEEKIIVKRVKK